MAQAPLTQKELHSIRSLYREKRLLAICFFIALAQFQYGYDSAAVSGFQSMPGFLSVFGYADVRELLALLKPLSLARFLTAL